MNAFLHFSSHGMSYKFDVAMKQEFKDPQVDQVRTAVSKIVMYQYMCHQQTISTTLMTDFKFSSFAAAEVLVCYCLSLLCNHKCVHIYT